VAQTLASIALARAIQRTGEARWPAANARSGGGRRRGLRARMVAGGGEGRHMSKNGGERVRAASG
jgi:hypothetical protein